MPLPRPRQDEPKDAFMRRCMSDDVAASEYPETGQRYAVCQRLYDDKSLSLTKSNENALKCDLRHFGVRLGSIKVYKK